MSASRPEAISGPGDVTLRGYDGYATAELPGPPSGGQGLLVASRIASWRSAIRTWCIHLVHEGRTRRPVIIEIGLGPEDRPEAQRHGAHDG